MTKESKVVLSIVFAILVVIGWICMLNDIKELNKKATSGISFCEYVDLTKNIFHGQGDTFQINKPITAVFYNSDKFKEGTYHLYIYKGKDELIEYMEQFHTINLIDDSNNRFKYKIKLKNEGNYRVILRYPDGRNIKNSIVVEGVVTIIKQKGEIK